MYRTLCYCILVPSKKFVGSIEFEMYRQSFKENLNDVITHSIFMKFKHANLPKAYLSDTPNFILIGHKRAEIQSRDFNREI